MRAARRAPRRRCPRSCPSYGEVGRTAPAAFLGLDLPVAGIAGDQQAALFGQACFAVGESKCTYGTGSFVLVNTGADARALGRRAADHGGLDGSVGELTYALEGAIFVTGAAVQWLRDGLGVIGAAAESEALAATVPDSGGVVFVPALTGLGAPDWDPHARGTILGITRGTTRAHLVRATLEAIAFEVRDVVELLPRDHDAAGRRRRGGQRAAAAAAGRPARHAGRAARGAGDDRARRGVPGRPRHRRLVVDRRACRRPGGWTGGSSPRPTTATATPAYRRWRSSRRTRQGLGHRIASPACPGATVTFRPRVGVSGPKVTRGQAFALRCGQAVRLEVDGTEH